jgi:NADPH:quinone reductase-like Zn-dependent oxidoreductase
VADAVGEVVALGSGTSRFHTGERVITNYCTRWIDGPPQVNESLYTLGNTKPGALAEYLVISENVLVAAPAYLSNEEAAALPCAGLTAWYALIEKGQLAAKQTILVQGTGGVSLFGLQIASALGAEVIVSSSSDEKLERVKSLGAKYTINYARTPDWEKEALAITNQQGVDHILEVVGGKNLMRSVTALKPGGQISVIGTLMASRQTSRFFP